MDAAGIGRPVNKASANLANAQFNKYVPVYMPPVNKPEPAAPAANATPAGMPTVAPKIFSTSFEAAPIFTTQFSLPAISLNTATDPAANVTVNANQIQDKGSSEFAALNINLVSLLTRVLPYAGIPVPPLSAQAKLDFKIGSASVSADALNVSLRPALNLTQTENILPTRLTASFNFGKPYMVQLLDKNDNVVQGYENLQTISIQPGQQIQFQQKLANDTLNLTPTYSVNANLVSSFGLSLSGTLPISILQGDLKGSLLGLSTSQKVGRSSVPPRVWGRSRCRISTRRVSRSAGSRRSRAARLC